MLNEGEVVLPELRPISQADAREVEQGIHPEMSRGMLFLMLEEREAQLLSSLTRERALENRVAFLEDECKRGAESMAALQEELAACKRERDAVILHTKALGCELSAEYLPATPTK